MASEDKVGIQVPTAGEAMTGSKKRKFADFTSERPVELADRLQTEKRRKITTPLSPEE